MTKAQRKDTFSLGHDCPLQRGHNLNIRLPQEYASPRRAPQPLKVTLAKEFAPSTSFIMVRDGAVLMMTDLEPWTECAWHSNHLALDDLNDISKPAGSKIRNVWKREFLLQVSRQRCLPAVDHHEFMQIKTGNTCKAVADTTTLHCGRMMDTHTQSRACRMRHMNVSRPSQPKLQTLHSSPSNMASLTAFYLLNRLPHGSILPRPGQD